jgi:hypothetical protein
MHSILGGAKGFGSSLVPCWTGKDYSKYCCSSEDVNCCQNSTVAQFSIGVGKPLGPLRLGSSHLSSGTSNGGPPPSQPAQQGKSTTENLGLKLGLGLGIPLAVALIAILIYVARQNSRSNRLLKERLTEPRIENEKTRADFTAQALHPSKTLIPPPFTPGGGQGLQHSTPLVESNSTQIHEIPADSSAISELGSTVQPVELSGVPKQKK